MICQSKECLQLLIQSPNKNTETAVLTDSHVCALIQRYMTFRDEVRAGKLGNTAILWMSYVDHIWLVMNLLLAVKKNDFEAYAQCLLLMPDLFFSYGGHNYARYLTFFSMFIANIETSHPGATALLRRGALSVARSLIPGNRCAVDKTIEETFMKHAKSRGGSGSSGAGLSGLHTNYGAHQRWTYTARERAKCLQATYQLAGLGDDNEVGHQHRDVRDSQRLRSEELVLRTVEAIQNFNNPFRMADIDKLHCISSGAPATTQVEDDMLRAEAVGMAIKKEFIEKRLKSKDHFFEPIKRVNLKTMAEMNKTVKLTSSQN